jgi:hypothetical protein
MSAIFRPDGRPVDGMPAQRVDIGVNVIVPADVAAKFAVQCKEVRGPLEEILRLSKDIRENMEAAATAAERLAKLKGAQSGESQG